MCGSQRLAFREEDAQFGTSAYLLCEVPTNIANLDHGLRVTVRHDGTEQVWLDYAGKTGMRTLGIWASSAPTNYPTAQPTNSPTAPPCRTGGGGNCHCTLWQHGIGGGAGWNARSSHSGVPHNDHYSSIQVYGPTNCRCQLYEHGGYHGRSHAYMGNGHRADYTAD